MNRLIFYIVNCADDVTLLIEHLYHSEPKVIANNYIETNDAYDVFCFTVRAMAPYGDGEVKEIDWPTLRSTEVLDAEGTLTRDAIEMITKSGEVL